MIFVMGDCMLCCDKYVNIFLLFCLIGTQSVGMLLNVSCVAVQRVSDLHFKVFIQLVYLSPPCDEIFHNMRVKNNMNVVELFQLLISTFVSSCHVLESDHDYNT